METPKTGTCLRAHVWAEDQLSISTPGIQVQKTSEPMPVKRLPFITLTKTLVMGGYLVMGFFQKNPWRCTQLPVGGLGMVVYCEFLL